MIKIPAEDIAAKILEKAGLSQEELDRKVKQKMDQLAGLISREGALHILANEHGVKLYAEPGRLKIRSLLAGMRGIELLGKVADVYEVREFQSGERKGKVGSLMLADETGRTRVVLWGGQTDQLAGIKRDDIILVQGAYVKDNQGRREVHLGDSAKLTINPEGETVDAAPQRAEAVRKGIGELQGGEQDIEVLGTILHIYDIAFFDTCPQCNRRARPQGEGVACEQHGMVAPATSYVLSVVLDDGSGNIRTVFFRNQVNNLLGKQQEEILAYRDTPGSFDQVKHDLLGRQVKVVGRATKNAMFDRLELTAQRVYPDPSAAEELQRLGGASPRSEETAPKASVAPAATTTQAEPKTEEEVVSLDDIPAIDEE